VRNVNLRLALGSSAALVLAVATLAPAIKSIASIEIATRSRLMAVSCADSSCLGLGVLGAAWNPPIIDRLHDDKWTISQVVHTSLHNGHWMNGVSCVTEKWCMVVGGRTPRPHDAAHSAFSEVWAGGRFRQYVTANATLGDLLSVSCTSKRNCIAVGDRAVALAVQEPMAERWDGSRWTLISMPRNQHHLELTSVSCASANFCLAVGVDDVNLPSVLFTERWNGTSWRVFDAAPVKGPALPCSPPPNPTCGGVGVPTFHQVACARSYCVAVGSYGLAERWNGDGWTKLSSPGKWVLLNGVACPAPKRCFAVGSNGKTSAVSEPAAYRLVSNSWFNSSPRPIPAIRHGGFSAVSCETSISCIAVGASSSRLTTFRLVRTFRAPGSRAGGTSLPRHGRPRCSTRSAHTDEGVPDRGLVRHFLAPGMPSACCSERRIPPVSEVPFLSPLPSGVSAPSEGRARDCTLRHL